MHLWICILFQELQFTNNSKVKETTKYSGFRKFKYIEIKKCVVYGCVYRLIRLLQSTGG